MNLKNIDLKNKIKNHVVNNAYNGMFIYLKI